MKTIKWINNWYLELFQHHMIQNNRERTSVKQRHSKKQNWPINKDWTKINCLHLPQRPLGIRVSHWWRIGLWCIPLHQGAHKHFLLHQGPNRVPLASAFPLILVYPLTSGSLSVPPAHISVFMRIFSLPLVHWCLHQSPHVDQWHHQSPCLHQKCP